MQNLMIGEGVSDRRIRVLLRWSDAASTGSRVPAPTVAPGTVSVVDLFPGTRRRRRSRRPQGPEDLFCLGEATAVGVWPGICARLSLGWIPARLPCSCHHPEVRLLQGPGGHAEDLLPLRKPAVLLFLCLCDNPTRRARGGAFPRHYWRGTASGPTGRVPILRNCKVVGRSSCICTRTAPLGRVGTASGCRVGGHSQIVSDSGASSALSGSYSGKECGIAGRGAIAG